MKYDKAYFVNKFMNIEDEKWMTGDFHNEERTQFCALGHCGCRHKGSKIELSEEGLALMDLLETDEEGVGVINDGLDAEDYDYEEGTPKARILAALKDLPNDHQHSPTQETPTTPK